MVYALMLAGCGSDEAAWAVHHAALTPSATGITGSQTWEFFDEGWAEDPDGTHFVCARAMTVTGAVVTAPVGCEGCVAAYELVAEELDSDCPAPLDTDTAYSLGVTMFGIGDADRDLSVLDRYPGRSLGWYISRDAGETMEAYGFAWDEALDWSGDLGAPGWATGQSYTLWPAYAWDLRD